MKKIIFFCFLSLIATGSLALAIEPQILDVPHPCYISLSTSGKFLVVSNGDNQVFIFKDLKKKLKQWEAPGNFVKGQKISMAIDGVEEKGKDIFVLDLFERKIFKLNQDLQISKNIDCQKCKLPMGIEIDRAGRILVADPGNKEILAFNKNNEWETFFDLEKDTRTDNLEPTKLKFDSEGFLYILDLKLSKVIKMDSSKKVLSVWGVKGSGDGEFLNPHSLAINKHGNLFVSDTDNNRIVEFTNDGKFIQNFLIFGKKNLKLNHPMGLEIDENDFMYIADSDNNRVIKVKLK